MSFPKPFVALILAALSAACNPPAPPPAKSSTAAPPPSSASASAPAPPPASASASASPAPAPPPPPPPFRSDETFSLLVRGGDVIDGSGAPAKRADVLVRGDRIAFVGDVDPSVRANRVLDATSAVIAPGFIDAHSHGHPLGDVEYALAMGVTTLVVGQDGASPAKRIGPWLDKLDAAHPRINVATLVGHATVRGLAGAKPEKMGVLVDEALREGAFGLSTGLEYDPGRLATMNELVATAAPVGARGGLVMSHLRSEDDDRIDAALDELLEMCRKSGARAHVAHLKIVLGKGTSRADRLLSRLDEARASGLPVTADLYPYTASYTSLSILFPSFARPPASYAEAKRSRRAALAAHLRARVEQRNGPAATVFGTGPYAGASLEDVAAAKKMPFEDVLIALGPNGAEAAYFVMDEAVTARLFADPFVMVGTDGGGGGRHPRGFGAFARVLEELVAKRKLVPLEEAIRKMTDLPATTLGLRDRGCVREGCMADLVVFIPGEVHARASFTDPYRLAEGMRFVVVGGLVEREGARATSNRGGRALRFAGRTAPSRQEPSN